MESVDGVESLDGDMEEVGIDRLDKKECVVMRCLIWHKKRKLTGGYEEETENWT